MKKYIKKIRLLLLHFLFFFTNYPKYICAHISSREMMNDDQELWTRRQNIGTILFDKNDVEKECWTNEELTLLKSRIIFQEILPQADLLEVNNDDFIDSLMDYIDICIEVVKKITIGRAKHVLLRALADSIGGYLRAYILPLTRKSYYAGNIEYRKATRLFDLYDKLKIFLRSNGVGWLKPVTPHLITIPIKIHRHETSGSCSELILYPDNSKGRSVIPLPLLDDYDNPNSIALPFEHNSLYSLYTPKSAFILVKYYSIGMSCLMHTSESSELDTFHSELNTWLQRNILHHLDDEKWYPAFGGILRVTATLHRQGTGDSQLQQYNVPSQDLSEIPFGYNYITEQFMEFETWELIMIGLVVFLAIWVVIGICVIYYKNHNRRLEGYEHTPVSTLYESIDHSAPNYSIYVPLVQSVFKPFPFWQKRTVECPCTSDQENNDDDDEEKCFVSICPSHDNLNQTDNT